jgi:phenylalanyl-tRNA synthetase alpha chain
MTELPEVAWVRKRIEQIQQLQLDLAALEAEHVVLLGRKSGKITELLKKLPSLPPEQRKAFGATVNELKVAASAVLIAKKEELEAARRTRPQAVDLSMPGRHCWTGAEHPVTRVTDEILEIFRELGFVAVVGPEVETDWYNFTALNFPADHPAMDMHDTLYLDAPAVEETPGSGRLLLRTHTSPVQIRTMLTSPPPIRAVMPGWVYRNDPFDPSHAPAFSQIEGLAVDEGISFVDLKATLVHFARRFFAADTKVRFRPSYFPFTEPSAEMDVECRICHGSGCPACKSTGWVEILGCGMVHPAVLRAGGVDPERYTGFAFGMGPHRITMQRHSIPDIRLLYEGDMRFLGQFLPAGRVSRAYDRS